MSGICIKCQNPRERTGCLTRFYIVKNATEYGLSIITTLIKKTHNKKMLYYYENKEKSLGSKKNDESVIKRNLIKNNGSGVIIEGKMKNYYTGLKRWKLKLLFNMNSYMCDYN